MAKLPLQWSASQDFQLNAEKYLPLVAFTQPCVYREIATAALDAAGLKWRIAVESEDQRGVELAIAAGLGIAVRSNHHPSYEMVDVSALLLLDLPDIEVYIDWRQKRGKRFDSRLRADLEQAIVRCVTLYVQEHEEHTPAAFIS